MMDDKILTEQETIRQMTNRSAVGFMNLTPRYTKFPKIFESFELTFPDMRPGAKRILSE